ncbi:Ubiquitin carboxyl-terminal hydrolase 5 [Corchorus olitorius]|uniref:Ubiquitin carboxyl-terminal hydrolase 5 n=1 Tax=Corchorus olitorius TaxID=93759 RepID=A0A1R3J0B0_9ROSI|nr:Ubiquitin carboxyl-terminal hydrolase 5 [Corchorus olitorius]
MAISTKFLKRCHQYVDVHHSRENRIFERGQREKEKVEGEEEEESLDPPPRMPTGNGEAFLGSIFQNLLHRGRADFKRAQREEEGGAVDSNRREESWYKV